MGIQAAGIRQYTNTSGVPSFVQNSFPNVFSPHGLAKRCDTEDHEPIRLPLFDELSDLGVAGGNLLGS